MRKGAPVLPGPLEEGRGIGYNAHRASSRERGDDLITWTVIGSGTHKANTGRSSPGHLVRCGEAAVLVDCGSGTFRGVLCAGRAPETLDACLVTHLHPDHIADLLPLLFRLRNEAKKTGPRELRLFGPPGTADYVEALARLHAPYLEHDAFTLSVEEGEGGEFVIGELAISPFPVAHGVAAVGYVFTDEGGAKVVYSGDTGLSAELIRRAAGADLLVAEASFPNGAQKPFHLTPEWAASIAAEASVRRLALVHLNPEMDGIDIVAQCGGSFKGEVIICRDGMSIESGRAT